MSMGGALASERAEEVRKRWVERLESAYASMSWKSVAICLEEMRKYRFSE